MTFQINVLPFMHVYTYEYRFYIVWDEGFEMSAKFFIRAAAPAIAAGQPANKNMVKTIPTMMLAYTRNYRLYSIIPWFIYAFFSLIKGDPWLEYILYIVPILL